MEPKTSVSTDRIDRILETCRRHLGMEIAFVGRYVDEDRELMRVSADIELPMGSGFREPRENSYCWHILEGRLPEMIQDAADHPFAQTLAITEMLPVGCHLDIPLRLSDGSLFGSFCALSRQPDRTITKRDMGVLQAFAQLAAEHIEATLDDDVRHAALSKRIGETIETGNVTIVHQPIHTLGNGRPVGVECLARFPDAEQRGPDLWFNEAAEIGLGLELELLAVRNALATLPYVPKHCYMTVNASPETVLSGQLEKVLDQGDRKRLVIEITEHHKVVDFARLAQMLDKLKPKARIAIDDVGAGYAGLRHIVDLAPDILKLDMSLTRDIHISPARRALTSAMVEFSREIGCVLVAEGIEVRKERETLSRLGVTHGQGYFYSRPLPVVKAQQWLLSEGRSAPGEAATSREDPARAAFSPYPTRKRA